MNNLRPEDNPKSYLLPSSKSRQQMAEEFGWRSVKTFNAKLEQNEIDLPSGSITPKWQKEIYSKLGYPACVSKEAYLNV